MLKPQLRTFLMDRGMTVSDYSVHQLRELAVKAVELDLPVIKTPDDTEEFMKFRSTRIIDGEKIVFPTVFQCIEKERWSDDLRQIPLFCMADVFAYLISAAKWSPQRLAAYKTESGYGMSKSQHISDVECLKLSHGHFYIKANCVRETAQKSESYITWCLLDCEGICASAGCLCTGYVFPLGLWCYFKSVKNGLCPKCL